MRTLALVLTLALAGRAAADVRVVVVHDADLLTSESRAIAEIQKQLGKRAGAVTVADATAAEAAAARALLAGQAAPLPDSFTPPQTILVLEVLPPTGQPSKRLSRGLGGILLLRPPAAEPVYVERITGRAEASLRGEGLADWLARAIALTAGSKP